MGWRLKVSHGQTFYGEKVPQLCEKRRGVEDVTGGLPSTFHSMNYSERVRHHLYGMWNSLRLVTHRGNAVERGR